MDKIIITVGGHNTTRESDRFTARRIMENYPHYVGILCDTFVFGTQLHIIFCEVDADRFIQICVDNGVSYSIIH